MPSFTCSFVKRVSKTIQTVQIIIKLQSNKQKQSQPMLLLKEQAKWENHMRWEETLWTEIWSSNQCQQETGSNNILFRLLWEMNWLSWTKHREDFQTYERRLILVKIILIPFIMILVLKIDSFNCNKFWKICLNF